jgi:hypothetical protein
MPRHYVAMSDSRIDDMKIILSFYQETQQGSGKYYLGSPSVLDVTEHEVQIVLGTVSLTMGPEQLEIQGQQVNAYTLSDPSQMPRFISMAQHLAPSKATDTTKPKQSVKTSKTVTHEGENGVIDKRRGPPKGDASQTKQKKHRYKT